MPRPLAQGKRIRCQMLATTLLLFATFGFFATSGAHAQSARTPIVGLPVFSADGIKIGQVIDVTLSANRQIEQIQIVTGSPLAFGERTVAVPQPAFIIRGGSVMLVDLSADDVQAFPNARAETP